VSDELSWSVLRREAEDRLRAAGVASPAAEARWLVEEASPDLDGPVKQRAIAHFDAMLGRREAGEPLQYVLGHWSFRSLDLLVDRRVLIPRPETEVVAGIAIDELRRVEGRVVVDLGTGSGAIALSVAAEVPGAEVWAVDSSDEALDVARSNVAGLGRAGARVRLARGDWFGALPPELRGSVDVVVSNPPYVPDGAVLPEEVAAWEPTAALYAGADGLDDIRRIIVDAVDWLRPGGSLVVELSPEQAGDAVALAAAAGYHEAEVRTDLTGRERVLVTRTCA
jgi:release factor glutamine methyltransferase